MIEFKELFSMDLSLLEIFIRGTTVYLGIFLMLRLVLKRQASTLSVTDLLVVVLIADAASNAMSGSYKSITDGLLVVATIIFWDYFLDWIGFHFPAIGRLIHPPELLLVKDGEMLKHHMRRELVTEEDLLSQMRVSGCESLSDIKLAYMEGDGRISIIPKDKNKNNGNSDPNEDKKF